MRVVMFAALAAVAFASVAEAAPVRGYIRKDGTYVAPSYRSNPNSTTLDNYSTRGNVNPYTGRTGTVDPFQSYSAPRYQAPRSTPSYGSSLYSSPRQPRGPLSGSLGSGLYGDSNPLWGGDE